jgi:hypothetical protein
MGDRKSVGNKKTKEISKLKDRLAFWKATLKADEEGHKNPKSKSMPKPTSMPKPASMPKPEAKRKSKEEKRKKIEAKKKEVKHKGNQFRVNENDTELIDIL